MVLFSGKFDLWYSLQSENWKIFHLSQCFCAMTLFYCAHWQTYVSGTLRFGKVDVTEAQIAIMIIHMISAVFGPSIWMTKVSCLFVKVMVCCLKNLLFLPPYFSIMSFFRIKVQTFRGQDANLFFMTISTFNLWLYRLTVNAHLSLRFITLVWALISIKIKFSESLTYRPIRGQWPLNWPQKYDVVRQLLSVCLSHLYLSLVSTTL